MDLAKAQTDLTEIGDVGDAPITDVNDAIIDDDEDVNKVDGMINSPRLGHIVLRILLALTTFSLSRSKKFEDT